MFSKDYPLRAKPAAEPAAYLGAYEPYCSGVANTLYNQAFCDDMRVDAPRPGEDAGPLQLATFGGQDDPGFVRQLASGSGAPTRARLLACRWLALHGAPVAGELLGVVVEMHLAQGLETVAAYRDGEVQYISHRGTIRGGVMDAIVRERAALLLDAAALAAGPAGVQPGPRAAPPRSGRMRATFLLPAGLCFTEGPAGVLQERQHAGSIGAAAGRLMRAIVDARPR